MTSATHSPIVTIQSLSNEGHGVAHVEGQTIFVPGTAPGDRAKIEITVRRKRWSRAKLIELLDPSPLRVEPRCPYVEQCGGCTWQHLAYTQQLKIKNQQLQETLQRIGGLKTLNLQDIVPSPKPFHYRNRIRGVVEGGDFHFHQADSHELIAIESCAIAAPEINEQLASINMTKNHQPAERQSIEIAIMPNGRVDTLTLHKDRSTELGFRQVNDAISKLLTETVLAQIEHGMSNAGNPAKPVSLLDLYCGHGTWSLAIANRHPTLRVVGVDSSAANIDAANKQSSTVENATFIKNEAEKILTKSDTAFDFVIVDPPRAGLSNTVVDALTLHPCQTLLYISCHPATLARDLALLCTTSYTLESVQAFDMFPQTPHVETMAVLQRTIVKPPTRPSHAD